MLKKLCHSCGILKESTEFYKNRARKDGLQTICKKCGSIRGEKYYEVHKEQIDEQHKRYYEDNKERITERHTRYREDNKEHLIRYAKRHREQHKEQEKARHRRYRKEHKKQEKAQSRKYYAAHKKQIACRAKKFRQTPNGKAASRRGYQNYYARKNNCEGSFSADEWKHILKNQNNRCNACGKKFSVKRPATMDHIVPVKHRGDHNSSNIQALCRQCNSSKNAKFDPHYIQTWAYS